MMKKKSKIHIVIISLSLLTILLSLVYIVASIPILELRQVLVEGGVYIREGKVRIEKINPLSPASSSTLEVGDIVVSVNGEKILSSKEFIDIVYQNRGKTIVITAQSKENDKTVELVPRETFPNTEGPSGLVLSDYTLKKSSPIVVIPSMLLQAYTGRGEPYFIPQYPKYGFFRLFWLIQGISQLIIAIGLLKLEKWGLYSYIFLRGFFILYGTYFLIISGTMLSIRDNYRFYLSTLFGIAILVFLYSQRKLFK